MNVLPDPFRQGDIQFITAKRLSYLARLKVISGLFVAGILVQLFLHFWLGLLLLAAATTLGLIRGYAAKPEPTGKEVWGQVTPDEYKKVKAKQQQLRKWDIDCFDITNRLGAATFFGAVAFCFAVWFILGHSFGKERIATYWAWDVLVVLAPHWVTGVRSFLTKDKLIIKIDLLEKIMETLSAPSDIQVLPMLSTRETEEGGRIPMDARLMIRFLDAPEFFLGMQVQVSLNNVQGKDYPYLYCVLIAKKEACIFKVKRTRIGAAPRQIVFEETESEGVDVFVIRQLTTKNSGYHTKLGASKRIVKTTLDVGRQLFKE